MNRIFLSLYLILFSSPLFAVQMIAIGAKVDSRPGISISVGESVSRAYHVAASIEPGVLAQIDLERFEYLLQYSSAKILSTSYFAKPYFGFGIRGETNSKEQLHEAISAKGTIGTELVSYNSPIQLFVDASPLVGPVPKLKFSGLARLGIRTQF